MTEAVSGVSAALKQFRATVYQSDSSVVSASTLGLITALEWLRHLEEAVADGNGGDPGEDPTPIDGSAA